MKPDQKVVLITGVSSGIGYAASVLFAKNGWHVAGTARREERLQQLADTIAALPAGHGEFLPIVADVRDAESMQSCVQQVINQFGRLDVLVANAGVGHRGSIVDADWAEIETLMQTNMNGVLHSVRAAVPAMKRGGHIVFVSSIVYNMTSPYAAVYAASKAFVSSLARSLRLELEPENILVTDMLVGRTETEFNEKRLGKSGRSGGGIPIMPVEQVAKAIFDVVGTHKKTVALRWIDRLILLGNMLVPEIIGRRAIKQYR